MMSRKETYLLYVANPQGSFPFRPTEIAGTMEELDTESTRLRAHAKRRKIIVKVTGNLDKIEIVRWIGKESDE